MFSTLHSFSFYCPSRLKYGGNGYGGSLDCLWIDKVQTKYNFVVPLRFTPFQYIQLIFLDFIVLFGTIVNNKIK